MSLLLTLQTSEVPAFGSITFSLADPNGMMSSSMFSVPVGTYVTTVQVISSDGVAAPPSIGAVKVN